MELILLLIYSFFVWLIFIKFKWLPWNIVSQVIVATIPVVGIAALILLLNIYAPSSADVRVMNYVLPINPRVAGKVIEVPVEPNEPVRKGDVLFRIDPTPFEIQVRSLEALLGRYPAAELQTVPELPPMPGPIPVGMPLDMLERRPDVIAAERRVAAAFNRVGEARAAQLPRIRLNASVSALDSEVLELQDDFENPSGGAGATLVAPLYQGGALRAQVSVRTAEQKEALARYASQVLRGINEVENALAASRMLSERVQLLDQVLTDQKKTLEYDQAAYRIGRQDLRSVQQQQQQVQSARMALLRVQSEQLIQRVNLHLALGGSFAEPMSVASIRPSTAAEPTAQAELTRRME